VDAKLYEIKKQKDWLLKKNEQIAIIGK